MKPMNLEKAQMNYGEVGVKNPEKLPTLFMDGLFFFFFYVLSKGCTKQGYQTNTLLFHFGFNQ